MTIPLVRCLQVQVHGIAKRLAETQHLDKDEVFNKWVWPLYDKYGHPYDAFKLFASGEEDIYTDIPIEPEVKEALKKIVSHQLAVQPVKVLNYNTNHSIALRLAPMWT